MEEEQMQTQENKQLEMQTTPAGEASEKKLAILALGAGVYYYFS